MFYLNVKHPDQIASSSGQFLMFYQVNYAFVTEGWERSLNPLVWIYSILLLQMMMNSLSPYQLRQQIRTGLFSSQTSGLASGYVQCNMAILPQSWAAEFLLFCQRNPKACSLVAVSEPGQFLLPELGKDIDLRTDLPCYRIFRHGKLTDEVKNVNALWQEDLVSFLIGCSFSFEEALISAGLEIRHISEGKNVPMYNTNLPCVPAGRFSGTMVVSMRPMKPADAIRAIQICSRFPAVHGAPVHFGDPEAIGIFDLRSPDYGEAVSIQQGEVPVFWACGVTPQAVIAQAKPEFCITHSPGHMLVTDLLNTSLASF